ncbi:MAG: hypothetical protein ABFS32_16635 [Bacteroidota bacterium]
MNNIIKILIVIVIIGSLVSCEDNNILDDLGTSDGTIVANVYMETLAPKLPAGLDRDIRVQYWSLDNKFTYTGLWDSVAQTGKYIVMVDNIPYDDELGGVFQGWTEYQEHPFNLANWKPDSAAYITSANYVIDPAYDKVTVKSTEITLTEFLATAPETYEDDVYGFYTISLKKEYLNNLMIDNAIMTQEVFDSHYAESGLLTDEGKVAIRAGLGQIGIEALVETNYSINVEYDIALSFRVINGTNKMNEAIRTFGVF